MGLPGKLNKPGRGGMLAAIVAIMVLAAAGAAAAIWMNSGKPAKIAYLEAEGKNLKKYSALLKNTVASLRESVSVYNRNLYKRRTELTVGIESGDPHPFGLKNAADVFDVIAKCKLVTGTKNDPVNRKSSSALSLLFDKSPLLDATLDADARNITISVPALLPGKYFGSETANLGKVYDRFGIPVKTKRIPSYIDAVNAVSFDGAAFDRSMKAYGDLVSNALAASDIRYGKDTTLDISGRRVKGREISVTLNASRTQSLIKSLLDKAAGDEALKGMTYGNAAAMSGLIRDSGLFGLLDFLQQSKVLYLNATEKKLLKGINIENDPEYFTKKLQESAADYEFPEGFRMTVIVDESGNILDRKINLPVKGKSTGSAFDVKIHTASANLQYNDVRNVSAAIEIGNDLKVSLETALVPGREKGDIAGTVKAGFVQYENGALKESIRAGFTIDSALDTLTLKRLTKVDYEFALDGSEASDKGNFNGEVVSSAWSNKKFNTRNSSTAIALNLQMPSFDAGNFKLKLNLAREDKLGIQPFELPAPGAESIVYLDRASDSELTKVSDEALASFGSFYITNKPIIDAILGTK